MSLSMLYADINDAVKDECHKECPEFTKEQGNWLIVWTINMLTGREFISANFDRAQRRVEIVTSVGRYYSPSANIVLK